MDEIGRPPPGGQRSLPLEAVESRDEAYLAAVDDLVAAGLPAAPAALLRWIIRDGRRDRPLDPIRTPRISRRDLAGLLGIGLGTASRAVQRLRAAHLLVENGGRLELSLPMLLEAAELAASQRQTALEPVSAADSLARLTGQTVPRCSTVFHDVPSCSTARPFRKNANTNPVSVSVMDVQSTDTVTDTGAMERAEQRGTPRNAAEQLKDSPAWQRLQTRHFQPIDVQALRPAFYAAVQAGLIDDTEECKVRFLATCYDLAHDPTIRSPAAVLRNRTERKSCYRISDDGRRWAKQQMRPVEHRRQ